MKALTPLLVLLAAPLLSAEEVTLKQSAILKSGRNLVSVKAGTPVELVSREGAEITIRYKGLIGKIPASKLDEAPPAAEPAAAPPKPAPAPTPPAPKAQKAVAKPEPKKPNPVPASEPRTGYGKAVKKAKDAAALHEKNLVRPTDEVLKER